LNIISQPAKSSGSKTGAFRHETPLVGREPKEEEEKELEELEELEDILSQRI
jgi:hypothetical protein